MEALLNRIVGLTVTVKLGILALIVLGVGVFMWSQGNLFAG